MGFDPENNYTTGIYIDKTLIIKAREISKRNLRKSSSSLYYSMKIQSKNL